MDRCHILLLGFTLPPPIVVSAGGDDFWITYSTYVVLFIDLDQVGEMKETFMFDRLDE